MSGEPWPPTVSPTVPSPHLALGAVPSESPPPKRPARFVALLASRNYRFHYGVLIDLHSCMLYARARLCLPSPRSPRCAHDLHASFSQWSSRCLYSVFAPRWEPPPGVTSLFNEGSSALSASTKSSHQLTVSGFLNHNSPPAKTLAEGSLVLIML